MRTALARTGAKRIVVMGQSYGADIVQTGLANLPADLRPRVAAIVLILPGDTVFYRADPSSLLYDHGTPDSMGATTGNRLTWAPLTCIYGLEETDSLCPLLTTANARKVGMPGGHNIRHDADGLLRHVLAAIRCGGAECWTWVLGLGDSDVVRRTTSGPGPDTALSSSAPSPTNRHPSESWDLIV